MAISVYPLSIIGSSDLRLIVDTDVDETVESNVFDGACAMYAAYIDNSANAAITYVKFYDTDTAPTVGTTAPTMILMCNVSSEHIFVFTSGVTFSVGLSIAAVTAAGTAGTTGPTSAALGYFVTG
jgi:hypothetical protein